MNIGSLGSYALNGYTGYQNTSMVNSASSKENVSAQELKAMKRSGQVQCEECANRKYKDGSDEGNVSFKAAAHISPESSAGKVMSHEQEHVSNAYSKAEKKGGEVVSASVSLKTAICPECGKAYVSGGVTNTAIKYPKTSYGENQKSSDYSKLVGNNIDYAV